MAVISRASPVFCLPMPPRSLGTDGSVEAFQAKAIIGTVRGATSEGVAIKANFVNVERAMTLAVVPADGRVVAALKPS